MAESASHFAVRRVSGGGGANPGCEADVRSHFQDAATLDAHGSGFYAARLAHMARARAVHGDDAGVARLAVISGDGRRLFQSFAARLSVGPRAENHVTAGKMVDVKPPVVGRRHLGAQI